MQSLHTPDPYQTSGSLRNAIRAIRIGNVFILSSCRTSAGVVVIPVRYESEDRLYCDCRLHQRQYDGIKCTELTGTIDSGCLYQRQGQCTFHVLLHIEESSRCCDCPDDQGIKLSSSFISATNWINPECGNLGRNGHDCQDKGKHELLLT